MAEPRRQRDQGAGSHTSATAGSTLSGDRVQSLGVPCCTDVPYTVRGYTRDSASLPDRRISLRISLTGINNYVYE